MKQDHIVHRVSMLVFAAFLVYAYVSGVRDYINDSIVSMLLVSLVYLLRKRLAITPAALGLVAFSFVLHNSGVFGWYNVSPIGVQWDHVTHIVGFVGVGLAGMQYGSRWLTRNRVENIIVLVMVMLAGIGVGVFIEFYEFAGFFIVGEGLGGLGHGEGDVTTEIGNSEWFNTIFDLIFNVVGVIIGVLLYKIMRTRGRRVLSSPV